MRMRLVRYLEPTMLCYWGPRQTAMETIVRIVDCHPMIKWPETPIGCPEASSTAEWVRAEAHLLVSHTKPTLAMMARKDALMELCNNGANRHLAVVRALMPLITFEGDYVSLQQAIHHQAQRWHLMLARQILCGMRGNAAIPWMWKEDTERNLDGL